MSDPLPPSFSWLLGAVILLAGPFSLTHAAGLKIMSEEDLSKEVGRDGIGFATNLNLEIGSYVYTPYDGASIQHNNLIAKGTVLTTFDVLKNGTGIPDVAQWYFPDVSTNNPLQIEYDLVVSTASGNLGTSVTYKDVLPNGSAFWWAVGEKVPTEGFDVGLATNLSIGNIILSPNGRKSDYGYGQMKFDGIKIESTTSGSAWVVADLKTQYGKIRFPVDNGVTKLQIGVDWPIGNADAATGKLTIGNVAFTNVPPQGSGQPIQTTSIGSSSIGSMQIQYLNIKFK